MAKTSLDTIEKWKQNQFDSFLAIWDTLDINHKKYIKKSSKTWSSDFGVRFALAAELNILRAAGALVEIIAFVQHDGTFAIDAHNWVDFNFEIKEYIEKLEL
jgi:hypothetical protein